MSDRRRTYGSEEETGNNIGIVADFIIRISKTESDPASMITVDGDPTPLLNGFRRCLAKSTEDNKINICYLDDSNSNYYDDGSIAGTGGGIGGDVFVYFPEFFYKGTDTDSEWVFNITTTQVDKDSYQDLGWHYAPASLVGACKASLRYKDGIPRIYSEFNEIIATEIDYNGFSNYARNRGAGFHLIDYQQHCIICWMFYARYKNTNSQAICGIGLPSEDSDLTGTTNDLGITDTTPSNAGSQDGRIKPVIMVNFLGIEGCWGTKLELIEGIHSYKTEGMIVYDKGDFHDQPYSSVISPTKRILRISSEGYSRGWISKIKGGSYMDMVGSEFNGFPTTYFCSESGYESNSTYIVNRSGDTSREGYTFISSVSQSYCLGTSSSYGINTGSRLAFDGEITVIESPTEFKAISNFR